MIGLIWAQSSGGTIGYRGALPWKVPEDLARFKNITVGHPVVMGRKTWESLGGALPHRTNVVVSRSRMEPGPYRRQDRGDAPGGVEAFVARSLAEALDFSRTAEGNEQIWVIGGSGIFESAIGLADNACVTYIEGRYQGDVSAPHLDGTWTVKRRDPDDGSWKRSVKGPRYRFVDYAREL